MRSEREMFGLILETAEADERIRGVCLQGSRINPDAPADLFRDYDILYIVRETKSFRADPAWIDRFGERLLLQLPEGPERADECWGWLTVFVDGNRLDLHVCTLAHALEEFARDGMYRILLDKDGTLPAPPAGPFYRIRRPSEEEYRASCNEFWWCLGNVARGLWREELTYALDMLNRYVRLELLRMLEWRVGFETDFSVSAGKCSKHLKRYLPEELYRRLLATYPAAESETIWESVSMLCGLFDETAGAVGEFLNVEYNRSESEGARNFLERVRRLPSDAQSIF